MDFKEKLLDSHLAFEQDVDLLHPIHKYRKNALKRFESLFFGFLSIGAIYFVHIIASKVILILINILIELI